jgi:hypothetical protein
MSEKKQESKDITNIKVESRYHRKYEVVKMNEPKARNPEIMALHGALKRQ